MKEISAVPVRGAKCPICEADAIFYYSAGMIQSHPGAFSKCENCQALFEMDDKKLLDDLNKPFPFSVEGSEMAEKFLASGVNYKISDKMVEGKEIKGTKFGMSIADLGGAQGARRIVVEVKNIDIAANMRTQFRDLSVQTGGYLSNVSHPQATKFWLFLDIRGQPLPPGGFRAIIESVNAGTGRVFDNIYLITEAGVVVY